MERQATTHGYGKQKWESNPQPSCCEVTALNAVPALQFNSIQFKSSQVHSIYPWIKITDPEDWSMWSAFCYYRSNRTFHLFQSKDPIILKKKKRCPKVLCSTSTCCTSLQFSLIQCQYFLFYLFLEKQTQRQTLLNKDSLSEKPKKKEEKQQHSRSCSPLVRGNWINRKVNLQSVTPSHQ